MSVDTPAHITILGAGPIGLETALYARYLGYDVSVYEADRVCENLMRVGHLRSFSPFGQIRSPLGLAALRAQDENWQPPGDDEYLTGAELIQRYYLPLAQSDLLIDSIHESSTVCSVGRQWIHKMEMPDSDDRAASDFRILLQVDTERDAERFVEKYLASDVLIDATGGQSDILWFGTGGMLALGEFPRACGNLPPDILEEFYANRHILLIGSGCSAASTAIAMAELHDTAPQTRVTWITRRETSSDQPGPVLPIAGGRLPQRDACVMRANQLVANSHPAITHLPGTTMARIDNQHGEKEKLVTLEGQHAGEIAVDEVIANVGFKPNLELARELQVQYCYATEAPEGIGRILRANPLPNDVAPEAFKPADLITKEPDFYILGAKSFGRDPRFTIAHGLRQIRDLFTIIGDRENLDLYATAASTMAR